MDTNWTKPQPMNEDQLEYAKEQLKQTYLFLIGHTVYDPKMIEIMKLSTQSDVQRRYEARSSWQQVTLFAHIQILSFSD